MPGLNENAFLSVLHSLARTSAIGKGGFCKAKPSMQKPFVAEVQREAITDVGKGSKWRGFHDDRIAVSVFNRPSSVIRHAPKRPLETRQANSRRSPQNLAEVFRAGTIRVPSERGLCRVPGIDPKQTIRRW